MCIRDRLIPNQIFINKLFAMSMISLMTTAYPKIVYDKTRVPKWDNRVGAAIGINGGDVNSVAKIIDPAQISPQIAQFIQLAIDYTPVSYTHLKQYNGRHNHNHCKLWGLPGQADSEAGNERTTA